MSRIVKFRYWFFPYVISLISVSVLPEIYDVILSQSQQCIDDNSYYRPFSSSGYLSPHDSAPPSTHWADRDAQFCSISAQFLFNYSTWADVAVIIPLINSCSSSYTFVVSSIIIESSGAIIDERTGHRSLLPGYLILKESQGLYLVNVQATVVSFQVI